MATIEESCPACGAQVFWERDRCLRCGHDVGAPNVRIAQQEHEALRQLCEMALADARSPNVRVKVEAFSQTVEQQSQAVINVDPNYLIGFLESSRDFYSGYALQTAAEIRAAANMENDTARLSVETKLFGTAAPHIRYAALSLNGRGLISYGSCAITLDPRLCARAASLLEENSYHFIEKHRLVGRIPIPLGHRAVWQDRHWLATAKLAQGIDDRTVADDFPHLLLHSNSDCETDRFIEVHIYGPFGRQAVVSAVIPQPGKSCKNKRKLYMLLAIRDLPSGRARHSVETGLISNAFVIGAVSAAVYQTEEGLRALRLDKEGGYVDCSRQAGLLLDCPAEKRLVVGASLQEIKQCLGLWSRRQQLLQQLIGGMDRALREDTRQLGLELAEKGLADADAAHFVRARLLACPPPTDADLDSALRLSASFPHCQRLYSELAAAKDYIAPTAQVLQELVYFDFPSAMAPDELYRTLVDRGVVAEAVTLSVNPGTRTLSGLVFQFRSDAELQRSCPRLTHLLTKFVNRLQALYPKVVGVPIEKGTQRLSETASNPLVEAVRQFLAWRRRNKGKRPPKHSSAGKAREAADKQKAFILQCMSKGRLPEAKKALFGLGV